MNVEEATSMSITVGLGAGARTKVSFSDALYMK